MAEQQEFDTSKFLMTMLKNEEQAEKQLNSLAKESSKYHEDIAKLSDTLERQQRESEKMLEVLRQRREDMKALNALNDAVQEKLNQFIKRKEQLQAQSVKTNEEHSQIKGCFRTLCDATDTLVSAKDLPTRLKGISISSRGDQWKPFDVSASDLKGLSTIWNRMQTPSENAAKWRQLLSSTSDKENTNISAASVIEIDLTSPPCHK